MLASYLIFKKHLVQMILTLEKISRFSSVDINLSSSTMSKNLAAFNEYYVVSYKKL